MAASREFQTQVALCNWLKVQYPQVIFRSDLGGIRLSKGLARKAKMIQKEGAYPDLFIAQPVGKYHGLFVEIKYELSDINNKNGTFVKSEHLFEQATMLDKLNKQGYYGDFGVGYDDCVFIITQYFNGRVAQTPVYKKYLEANEKWYYGRLPGLRLSD